MTIVVASLLPVLAHHNHETNKRTNEKPDVVRVHRITSAHDISVDIVTRRRAE